ncbi:MAG: PadR family transcriptional regulator [Dehalococcoidia bacterium]|jgi:DNA-binding PadR family transcriptional regulator
MQRPPWFDFERLHGRLFEKGDLKYVILQLVSERPAHGYEVIKALEERFGGMYTPSAGAVYPTLQLLEDMGYVTSTPQDGKRVFSITDEGKMFLEEQKDVVEGIRQRTSSWWNPHLRDELHEMKHDVRDLLRLIFRHGSRPFNNPETIKRVRGVIDNARKEIETILHGQDAAP